MEIKNNPQLLANYMAGECSEEEKHAVDKWLRENPDNRKLFEKLEMIWETGSLEQTDIDRFFDAKEDWKDLQHRLHIENNTVKPEKLKPTEFPHHARHQYAGDHHRMSQLVQVAAILLIAILFSIFAWHNFYQTVSEEETVEMRELVAERGQRVNFVLSDGTGVILNAESKLGFPERFQTGRREVYMIKGEAFFDVAGNTGSPFFIYTEDAVVRVTGTSFSVRHYPEDDDIRVVVKEGSVVMGTMDGNEKELEVYAGQLGQLHLRDRTISRKEIDDMELYLSWTEGFWKFRNALLKDVALQLERRYNIEVGFSDPDLKNLRLSATLMSRSMDNVLNVISASLGIGYERYDGNRIVFLNE